MGYFYGFFIRNLDLRDLLRGLPVVPLDPGNYHVTILYVGDRSPRGDVGVRLRSALTRFECFNVELGGLILLPSESKPRVLAMDILDQGNGLVRIRSAILNILNDFGVNVRDRFIGEFRPHMTIGYIRSKVDPWSLKQMINEIEIPRMGPINVRKISLIQARGEFYREVEGYDLTCPA
ncbi:2'-5' RNA ligase family protein [Vulcanisaeta thermophila]|uniref:2'-5' RNA ligase family protein n=1 Tax=Vulcanisaeta thermophila TaxID=867917 RepID=UPI0008536A67|nr:2'-5' RNA ligase family protein [Vulcanisaeta thermophila]